MKIGIDISQVAYERTGVAKYIKELIPTVIQNAPKHEFILFGCSFRQRDKLMKFCKSIKLTSSNVKIKIFQLPLRVMDLFWNTLHIFPIAWWTGSLDIFWSSDWVQPPIGKNTIGITTVHDLSFLRFPEAFPQSIVSVQKRRMSRVFQECSVILCDSEATKRDLYDFYHINGKKSVVVYPGYKYDYCN